MLTVTVWVAEVLNAVVDLERQGVGARRLAVEVGIVEDADLPGGGVDLEHTVGVAGGDGPVAVDGGEIGVGYGDVADDGGVGSVLGHGEDLARADDRRIVVDVTDVDGDRLCGRGVEPVVDLQRQRVRGGGLAVEVGVVEHTDLSAGGIDLEHAAGVAGGDGPVDVDGGEVGVADRDVANHRGVGSVLGDSESLARTDDGRIVVVVADVDGDGLRRRGVEPVVDLQRQRIGRPSSRGRGWYCRGRGSARRRRRPRRPRRRCRR